MPVAARSMGVRPPEVAGVFYPAGSDACTNLVMRCLRDAQKVPPNESKVIVAPHAGHVYSGPIAGTALAQLRTRRSVVKRVVIFGPAHRANFKGMATTSARAWASPLGKVRVDWQAMEPLLALGCFRVDDGVFAREHGIEVQIPFLQAVLDDFSIVPVLVGDAGMADLGQVLEMIWGGPETLILISSDLSHYHDYETARKLDGGTTKLIELMRPDRIDGQRACGYRALGSALRRARALDMRVTALDVRNSGDTRGDRDRVVGYGAFAMEYAATARLSDGDRALLLDAARASLSFGAENGRAMRVTPGSGLSPALTAIRASFVTITIGGKLRGCRGSVIAQRPLLLDVVTNTYKAAFEDRRFDPVTVEELAAAELGISVLSTPRPIRFADEADLTRQLRPDVDGLILHNGDRNALFLPSVWGRVPRPERFLRQLKQKACLAPDHWSESLRFFRYTVESFGP